MIVSKSKRFVFFHNPKVGGTSVRATIETFNDIGFGLWGTNAAQTGGHEIDRAHLGVDEFVQLYPKLWEDCCSFAMFSLYRDPLARFYSSVAEHSKLHGTIDIRFATDAQRMGVLFSMIERLAPMGSAESSGVMGNYELTHFKPQWIYRLSADPAVHVRAYPVERMKDFFADLSALTGQTLMPQTRNTRESLDLPASVAALASSGTVKRAVANLPGMNLVKAGLRRRFAAAEAPKTGFRLSAGQEAEVKAFVSGFYAEDYARWPAEPVS